MNSPIKIPENIEKVERNQWFTFLNTTPSASSKTFALLGVGIVDYGISYNPDVESQKWIIESNARNIHKSNNKQGSVSQEIYKNDPCFEFVKNGRDKLNYVTEILDVDGFDGNNGTYPAKLTAGKIVITQFMSDEAVIEYDLYYEGDAVEGTVTFADGVPTFVPNGTSL